MILRINLYQFTRFATAFLLALFLVAVNTDLQAQTAERRIHIVEAGQTLYSISRMYDVSVDDIRRWNNLRGSQINVGQRLIVSSAQTGQPRATPPVEVQSRDAREIRHQVRSGETLFSISRRYGVTVSDIREWNRLRSNLIEVGQVLIIREAVQDVAERPATVTQQQAAETNTSDTAQSRVESTVAASTAEANVETETSVESPPDTEVVDQGEAIRSGPVASAYYTVRAGDTVSEIARRHGITPAELLELNSLRSDRLAVGQVLLVRRPQGLPSVTELRAGSTAQGRFATYQVRRGERLNEVLRQFQMTEPELAALNPDVDITSLAQGQSLTVLLPPDITYANPYRVYSEADDQAIDNQESESVPVLRYGNSDRGRSTTSGDLYNPDAFTAAHNRLPLGTVLFVQNPATQSGIFVLVNDRMVEQGLRLSHAAFDALGFEPTRSNNAIITTTER